MRRGGAAEENGWRAPPDATEAVALPLKAAFDELAVADADCTRMTTGVCSVLGVGVGVGGLLGVGDGVGQVLAQAVGGFRL